MLIRVLACLARTDEPMARKALRQFKLHPQMGNEVWRDKFRAIERKIFR